MKPQDFPVNHMMNVECALIAQADANRTRAREAAERLETGEPPNSNRPMFSGGTPIGYYESALAYYEAARQVNGATSRVVADLDRAAAKEAQRAQDLHAWPITHLENLSTTHRDPGVESGRHPRWGASDVGQGDQEQYLALMPSSADPEDLLLVLTRGEHGNGHKEPTSTILFTVDATRWRALNALAERIFAGRPVPYGLAGNYHAQEPTDD